MIKMAVSQGREILQVLQICHCYYPPFLDCARQYSKLFEGTEYKVVTVYLTGEPSEEVARATCSDEVIFLGYKSSQVRGLKLKAIAEIRKPIIRLAAFGFWFNNSAGLIRYLYIVILIFVF